jgi:hypothetical protein
MKSLRVRRGIHIRLRLVLPLSILLALPVNGEAQPPGFKTTVAPVPNENLAGPCSFELSIPDPTKHVRAVWITYGRRFDISRTIRMPRSAPSRESTRLR